ncbi:MAG: hypothetical protein HY062_14045 [Bacteroidetes bacterium]|nr:hypothetical protein [Bacteroidota bacterium]
MQNITYKSIFAAITISALVSSCKPKIDVPEPDKGSVDASKYVAIGNSITSGFADGALYYDGQMVSYPNLLAEQLKLIGGGDFVQPLTPAGSVGIGSSANAKLILGYKTDCKGVTGLSPVPAAANGDYSIFTTSIASQGPFNNMGVPGAKATTVVYPGYGNPANGFGNYNPFFTRMLAPSEYATASMLAKAAAQSPTFFSVFIGNNDVLGYALGGGTGDVITPSAGGPGVGFDASIDLIINTMTANGAKGVVGNIPDVTSIPYCTTVPYNGLTLDATQASQLSMAYSPLGISFSEGSNPFIIADPAAPGGMRKIKSTECVLLTTPQDSLKCAGWGSTKPIPDKYILTDTEISNIRTAVAAYNSKLQSVANAKGLAYVDVNAFMANAKTGIAYNGINISSTFVSGGAFSLDGIHLTPRGNALLANEFIKAINSTYGSTIPQVNVAKYDGVKFP